MQVDHLAVAGALVQAVDVLGQQQPHLSAPFQCRQCPMRGIGLGAEEARPADAAARPVASVGGIASGQLLQGDRRAALPFAVAVAVVGDARTGAAAGAGEDEQALVAPDPVAQGAGGGPAAGGKVWHRGHGRMLTGGVWRIRRSPGQAWGARCVGWSARTPPPATCHPGSGGRRGATATTRARLVRRPTRKNAAGVTGGVVRAAALAGQLVAGASRPRFFSSGSIRGSWPVKSTNSCLASLAPPRESRVLRRRSPFSGLSPPLALIHSTVLASSTSDQM